MEAVNIRIGPLVFDHADYDADGDVLYLHVGRPQPGEGEETPEGHVVRFAPGEMVDCKQSVCLAAAERGL